VIDGSIVKLLVTGGAGFIGSALVRGIVAGSYPELAGAEVVVLDKLTYAAGGFDNLGSAAGSERVRLVHGDVCDPRVVDEVTLGCDAVLHLAAESHVDRSIVDASVFTLTNVVGTQTVLAAALRHRVDRFVQVSTDEVYGSVATGAWTEASPLAPNSPYAATKAGGDLMARAYGRTHGLDVRITRGSNTYGPHQYPEKIVPLFTTRLLDGGPVPLYGEGANVREWLHVEDHCRGIVATLTRGRAGEIYNLGGGRALSNRELTGMLLALTGRDRDSVRHVADRPGHDLRYALDGAKAARELGYAPMVAFEDGLAATVDWYREHRSWWEPRRAHPAPVRSS
jgi:dTDP-glucose 4,6-dehydratase